MLWLAVRFCNLVLAASASYGAYSYPPQDYPYAFAACAIGITYGVYGLLGGQEEGDCVVKDVLDDLLDFAPLALINIQMYKGSDKPYALVHGLFVVPMALDITAKLFGEETDDFATEALKHISNMANMASLFYLAFLNKNYKLCSVALSFMAAHVGALLKDAINISLANMNYALNYACFYFFAVWSMTKQKQVETSGE